MKVRGRLIELARAMERDLRDNVLPFWAQRVPDERHGGFLGWIGDDLTVDPSAPKGGVLNSRILWTFAAAFRRFGEPAHREVARRAFVFLRDRFWDETYGGIVWMLDHEGRPLSDRKQTYNLAFAIYGLAEYALATGEATALDSAIRLYRAVEEHAADRAHGGYWEARRRDWGPLLDVRLSDRDRNAPKSMNTHLHVMEAYTNLLRAWDDPGLRSRLGALVSLHIERIVDRGSGHLRLFFDEEWRPIPDGSSFGHDIEASWLLMEAAEAVGDSPLRDEARGVSARLARATIEEGLDREHGGIFAERGADGTLDDEKHWWMQAEAIVGFLDAWQRSGDLDFLDATEAVWRFVERFVVDRVHGEWRWRVRRDGGAVPGLPKVEPWKCPYHNSRAALEVSARAGRLQGERDAVI